jgi:hypothetical protein
MLWRHGPHPFVRNTSPDGAAGIAVPTKRLPYLYRILQAAYTHTLVSPRASGTCGETAAAHMHKGMTPSVRFSWR